MKIRFKSTLMLLLVLTMMVSIAACGSNTTPSSTSTSVASSTETAEVQSTAAPKQVVKLNAMLNGDAYKAGWEALVSDINSKSEQTGYSIEVEKMPGGDEGSTLQKTRFATGDFPDITSVGDVHGCDLFLGGIKNFIDQSDQDWVKNFDANFLALPGYSLNGKVYGIPVGANQLAGMLYNKKVFSDLNLQIPNTWAELLAVCEKIKAAGKTPVYYAGKDTWTLQIIPLVGFNRLFKTTDNLAWFAQLNTNKIKYADNAEFVDSIKKFVELKDKGFINKNYLSDTYADGEKQLADGTCAMVPNATWMIDEMVTKTPDKMNDIGGFAIPFDGNDYVAAWTAAPIVMTSKCKDMAMGNALMNYLGSKEAAEIYFKAQPGLPAINDIDVGNLPVAQQELYKIYSAKGRAIANWQYYNLFIYSADFAADCQKAIVGRATAEQVAKAMDDNTAKDAKSKNDPNFK